MDNQSVSGSSVTWHSRLRWAIVGAGFLLALFALIVVVEEVASGKLAANLGSGSLDLLTALTAVGGAVGYALRLRWGVAVFSVSVLGHFVAHLWLISRAFAQARGTIFAIGGLLVIPVASLIVWAAMRWESKYWQHG